MNTNNVISADAAADLTGKEYYVVYQSATGINLATAGVPILGTLLRGQPHQEDGVYLGKAVGVLLWPGALHFATIGASTAAVTRGDKLAIDPSNPGKLVPAGSYPPVAVAFDSFTAANGAQVRVFFLSEAGEGGGSAAIVVPQTAIAQVVAQTQDALTDSSGGTASTTLAAITAGGTYAQADIVALKNAVATFAAENTKIKADVAAVRTSQNTLLTELATAKILS